MRAVRGTCARAWLSIPHKHLPHVHHATMSSIIELEGVCLELHGTPSQASALLLPLLLHARVGRREWIGTERVDSTRPDKGLRSRW